MTPSRGLGAGGLDRLGPRLVAILTLALVPLGVIAVLQTVRLIDEAEKRIDAALLGETVRAAESEQENVLYMIGAARALGLAADTMAGTADECIRQFKSFVEREPNAIFAGFIPLRGQQYCSSYGPRIRVFDDEVFSDEAEEPGVRVFTTPDSVLSGDPAIIISVPLMTGDRLDGYIVVLMPHDALVATNAASKQFRPLELITFGADGEVLTSSQGLENVEARLPANRSLAALTGPTVAFHDNNNMALNRIYTVTPLVNEVVYVLATWAPGTGGTGLMLSSAPGIVLPFLMWLSSLMVAYFAVHRLVIRHIRRLRQRIRVFSSRRRIIESLEDEKQPTELRELSDAFESMAITISRDEAELENSLHEKDVLLREVYHRVRNNLQLIASINNMQIRAAGTDETRHALRRLQDRIIGLSTIHHTLYQAAPLSRIRTDVLIGELLRQVISKSAPDGRTRVELKTHLDPIRLYPDQAVPMSLLLVEAVSNAAKYGDCRYGRPWIDVSAREDADGWVHLVVRNSTGPMSEKAPSAGRAGLGAQLINAFVVQLEGESKIEQSDDIYSVSVRFRASDFGEEADAADALAAEARSRAAR